MKRWTAIINAVDSALMKAAGSLHASGFKRFVMEFFFFTLKQARACLFAGLFFLAVMAVPRSGLLGLPRYDLLLVIALLIQAWMVVARLESLDELKAITLFHLVGLGLELFKTSSAIGSWSYPDPGFTKVFGVPLFSGFMYAAVGSYIIQAWRLFDLKIKHHPRYWMATAMALLIYINFFTHHYIGDYRWYITACALGLYARSMVLFRPADRERRMPLLLSFLLIGFFLWVAENFSTFLGIWAYPDQLRTWSVVHLGKWSSWSLLVIMTFTIVASLKRIKATVHVPK
ncbi:MAG TPA: DUF817 domain-containing protein [Symbiobacteriaceae bacterium]|nr:DUF817 domain-containing protein [Symbiobacteriaceae bacterium]